jgi:hypothetical protein
MKAPYPFSRVRPSRADTNKLTPLVLLKMSESGWVIRDLGIVGGKSFWKQIHFTLSTPMR